MEEWSVMTNWTMNERIGHMLMMSRVDKKMSQTEVADRLGTSKSAVSYLETGKKNITVIELMEFCSLYGAKWDDIIRDAASQEKIS